MGSSTLTPLVVDIHGDEGSTGDLKLSEFGRFLKQGKVIYPLFFIYVTIIASNNRN